MPETPVNGLTRYHTVNRIRKKFKALSTHIVGDRRHRGYKEFEKYRSSDTPTTDPLGSAIERYLSAVSGDMNLTQSLRIPRPHNGYYAAHIQQTSDYLDSIVIMDGNDLDSYVVAEVMCILRFTTISYTIYTILEDNFTDVDRMLFILNN